MRKIIFFFCLSIFSYSFLSAQSNEAEETGFAGDHFSLEGAIEVFKNSSSIEDFEKKINEEKNYVNNLDLNEDGKIDYVRVEDKMDGDLHAIILQVPVSESETQDIAVIEIEKTGKESAILQIIGDEEIYGETKIVEPFSTEIEAEGKGGPSVEFGFRKVMVNVFFWTPIRVIYAPRYRPWVSPFRWRTYPRWWSPWRPYSFSTIHRHRIVYHRNYHVVRTHRVVRAHRVYTPYRRTSVTVQRRTKTVRVARKTTGSGGVKRKTTTTTVKKRNGNVVGKQKKTTAVKKNKNRKAVKKSTKRKVNKKRGN